MKDAIGQEINVGDMVVRGGGHADLKPIRVKKVCKQKVTLEHKCPTGFSVWPYTVVVVSLNLAVIKAKEMGDDKLTSVQEWL